MQIKPRKSLLRLAPAAAGFTLAGILPLLVAAQAQALEFSFADDEITGSLDNTASYGQLWRVKSQDNDNDGINGNDGNRNFDTGLVSQVFKLTSDLSLQYQNYGAFVRGTALYDTELMNHNSDYNSNNDPSQPSQSYPHDSHFGDEAQDISGQDAKILDAYLYGDWDVANMPLNVKVGKQVFNWGEALFVRDGINTSNPVDASAFRLPGSEIKEVLIPTEALGFNLGITDDLSVEGYYQWAWTETVQDPVGTYYSNDDLFAPGGNYAYNNFSDTPLGQPVGLLGGATPLEFYSANPALAQFFGFQGDTFIYPENGPGNQIARVATINQDLDARDGGQWGANAKYIVEELNSTEFGVYFINYHTKEPLINSNFGDYTAVPDPGLGALYPVFATIDLLGAINAQREYVEDVRMYGFSFSTSAGDNSYFGEIAYRPNMPIGISTSDDMLGDTIAQAPNVVSGGTALVGGQDVGLGDSLSNYKRVEMYNYSIGSIQNWGPALGFNSLFSVAEVAGVSYRGDSLQYTAYDGSNRYFSGAQNAEYLDVDNSRDNQINRNAYSYTLLAQGTWNDVFAGVNLSPNVAWKHDFEGNSHQAGSYVEGTKAYTVGLNANYQNTLEAEIAYTDFFGAGNDNGLRDRDNIGVNVKYSF
ncbi:DUF1302 domain-containing protein [Pseudomonas sp. N040]|uniref:DUF1302 domain-containing protein n=1 Tax=Pseudomonas sp. N040 TaxID=2785325 RepID=UPI0018A2AC7C|nr:DUF1302 domain-containing protein [Pseudomonas sp. N040]MBF7731469.1 DUF1302 domain-containing protein [Pseudomonas sp. N040]MBW7015113.1 DUF1302 domain-containing protein [Pseudomonas sp. N040]